jgi:chromosome segregation ATPase
VYLRSISMKGFKSFPERTSLEFSPGVSVIVGPNGSGKSNITDAVLWALGEQSPGAIRGASMQDVISAGGKGIGQRRAAEVEVVIDNSDGRAATEFAEIAVERRLDRSGDSGYRLNGARCRLTDVSDVLSDTNLGREMHSVISQGRVETIVHSKPRERRLLVEEAAGLGKHRKRQRRAELKLRSARDNLDRALDVEREARARLRPLKRQAQAAELGARIERDELGLRARLVAEELRFGADRAAAAEAAAAKARTSREKLEERLAAVGKRRREAEERFAARDRERTQAWGLLTKLRGEQERVAVRVNSLSSRETELEAGLENLRAELGPLTLDVSSGAPGERARKLEEELGEIDAGLRTAGEGLDVARSAEAAESAREAALADVRAGAERASRHARRAEGLLGERHREALRARVAAGEELLDDVRSARLAAEAAGAAIRARVERIERKVVGGEGDGDEIAEQLRVCSQQEFELQAEMKETSDELTRAEVESAHLGDRRAEAERELASIAARLGEEIPPAEEALSEEARAEIDRRLERLERRRAQIGPVNPLAEQEYDEAREHVEALQAQREDIERSMRELESLIRDIDAEIERAFEETFEATAKNFEEMVEHLFPGGRGRLRRVSLRPVRDDERPAGEQEAPTDAEPEPEPEEQEEERDELGVEIEVTPAGKSTRKLSLLSGGEKSLVALAFVFAVFLARPCPFYILDEVEAALDDANIDRFLQLIRRFSDRAQFVIVTHQKRTMDAADVLYGVSMGGDGVTKVVSKRLPRDAGEDAEDEGEAPGLSAVA